MKYHKQTPRQRKKLLLDTIADLQEQGVSIEVLSKYTNEYNEVEREISQENAKHKAYQEQQKEGIKPICQTI